jgi:hypothetical protein
MILLKSTINQTKNDQNKTASPAENQQPKYIKNKTSVL